MSTEVIETMRPASRYLFDEVFAIDAEPRAPEAPRIDTAALEAAVAEAREAGRREGREAALAEADADLRRRIADTNARILRDVARLAERRAEEERAACEAAVRIGVAAARKLGGALVRREPEGAIEDFLRQCIGWAGDAPHLVIRVAPDLADTLSENFKGLAAEQGFRGRTAVMPDPELGPGDARVDWADGGAVRDGAAVEAAVAEAVERYLAARGTADGSGD